MIDADKILKEWDDVIDGIQAVKETLNPTKTPHNKVLGKKTKNVKKTSLLVNFWCPKPLWSEFKRKYSNSSHKLRDLVKNNLLESSDIIRVKRDNIKELIQLIHDSPALQVTGSVGVGKSTAMQKVIEMDTETVYIVIDAHNEYDNNLKEQYALTPELIKESCVIKMPENVEGAKGYFGSIQSQALSRKFPDNFVLIVEEAHRYSRVKELLKESRKFIKTIVVTQEPLGSFTPIVEVIQGGVV